ncbi:MAG: hypothetical protein RJB39_748 [Candidatus Parcubacteria bacterium]|jgi:hypothetical protein
MNKKTWIVVILVIIVTALVTWYVTKQKGNVETQPHIINPTATTTKTAFEVKTLNYSVPPNKAVFEYIQFPNQPARSALAKLNLTIESASNSAFKTATKELDGNLKDLQKYGMNLEGREFVHQHEIDKDRVYVNDTTGLVSIVFENYVDFGGAHGSFFYGSIVYDLKTGDEVKLSDLLTGDYNTFLNAYVGEQVASKTAVCKNCENLEGKIDAVEGKTVSDSFALTADGMTLLYGAYDLGSYAATASGQEIFVPKEKLKAFIKRDW